LLTSAGLSASQCWQAHFGRSSQRIVAKLNPSEPEDLGKKIFGFSKMEIDANLLIENLVIKKSRI